MDTLVLAVFITVYVGMMLGRIPGLRLGRAGIALLGAVVLVAAGRMTPAQAWGSIDAPTIVLLFALMLISNQFRLAGVYAAIARKLALAALGPKALLAVVVATVGVLSAVLGNDIICLAVTPILIEGCESRGLDPVIFLLALACAANVGSAATLIGNPQIILIGQTLHLSFTGYLLAGGVPAVLGLVVVWGILCVVGRGTSDAIPKRAATVRERDGRSLPGPLPYGRGSYRIANSARVDRRQAALAVVVTLTVIGIFLGTDWPRAVVALVGGCVLLVVGVPRSRSLRMMHRLRRWPMARVLFHGFPRQAGGYVYAIRAARGVTHSVKMLALVDWPLLILFIGLFVVNGAMRQTGMVAQTLATASSGGWNLTHPANLFISTAVLSNLVSNVPAVMLLLPTATHHAANPSLNGAVLALASTLAGNLLIVGSIANIIVVGQAKALGVHISWWRHAKIGIPVTLATLAVAAGWLWLWWRFL